VRTSVLQLYREVWQVLQRSVRSYGKNTGHRLPLWASWLPGENALDRFHRTTQHRVLIGDTACAGIQFLQTKDSNTKKR
jgi:hypothetical protein